MMRLVFCVLMVIVAGCSGGGETPSSPTAPRPAAAPAPAPPPAPTLPNFAGRWVGEFVVLRCDSSGAFATDVALCKEYFAVGSTFGVETTWNQSGREVRGTVAYGQFASGLDGNEIRPDNSLTFNSTFLSQGYRIVSSLTVRSSTPGVIDPGSSVQLTFGFPDRRSGEMQLSGSVRRMLRL